MNGRKMYRAWAGDRRAHSQITHHEVTIAIEQTCKQCSTRFETSTFVPDSLCPKCSAKKVEK